MSSCRQFCERESDVLCEIPYRNDAAHQTLVCVFVEHQTQTDWLVPLKTLIYAVLYWEWQWRPHEKAPTPRPALEFSPLIPIVLFTGPRPWGSARQLRDLFYWPARRHPACSRLATRVLGTRGAHHRRTLATTVFLKTLTILKADQSSFAEATTLFQNIFEQIDPLHEAAHNRWMESLKFLFGWSHNKRPADERPHWHAFALQLRQEAERHREIEQMSQTIAQSLIEEGKQLGREEGSLLQARTMLIRFGSKLLAPPSETTRTAIHAINDLQRLERMTDQLDTVTSWADLLKIM